MARRGQSLILSSLLAILSYVPFEIIAKLTLIFCGLVFVLDPIPPTSRIVSLISVVIVGLLGKLERKWREENNTNIKNNIITSMDKKET